LDYEGVELPNAEAAYEETVGALAETIRDGGLEGATAHRFMIEVHDDIFESKIYRKNSSRLNGRPFPSWMMSPFGTFRTWRNVRLESAFGGKADMGRTSRHVCL
jgi:hypothetical protein